MYKRSLNKNNLQLPNFVSTLGLNVPKWLDLNHRITHFHGDLSLNNLKWTWNNFLSSEISGHNSIYSKIAWSWGWNRYIGQKRSYSHNDRSWISSGSWLRVWNNSFCLEIFGISSRPDSQNHLILSTKSSTLQYLKLQFFLNLTEGSIRNHKSSEKLKFQSLTNWRFNEFKDIQKLFSIYSKRQLVKYSWRSSIYTVLKATFSQIV